MIKYYTRACNFYYGSISKEKIKKKLSLPLNGNNLISFDNIEIITRSYKKIIHIKEINKQKNKIRKKINEDIKLIIKKKKINGLKFLNLPILMGIINLTPDSFSDGGKYNKNNEGYIYANYLLKKGCKILDIGGESTRPGAKDIKKIIEWKRINKTLKKIRKLNKFISLDTRKSWIMEKGIKSGVNLINDVSGLDYDVNTINVLKKV